MPYSDNLYSALDDDSDFEPIGESSSRHGEHGLGVTHTYSTMDTNVGFVGSLGEEHAASSAGPVDVVDVEDPQLLSPTDGYFTAADDSSETVVPASSSVPYVPNVLVEDPSLRRSTAEGKEREAAQERTRNGQGFSDVDGEDTPAHLSVTAAASRNGPSSAHTMSPPQQSITPSSATYYTPSSSTHITPAATPSSYTAYSPRRPAYHGQHLPFIPREAPPAYTPSPISQPNSRTLGDISSSYSTFSQTTDAVVNMGRPEETQSLLPRQPESMRDSNSNGLGEASPIWRHGMKKAREHSNRRSCKIVLIAMLLLLVTVGLLPGFLRDTKGRTGHRNPSQPKPPTKPGQPNMSYPELDGGFSWNGAGSCKDAQIHRHTQTFGVDFGADKQLGVIQRVDPDEGRRGWGDVHVQGAVIFRRAGPGTPDSAITLEVTVTDDRLTLYSSWDAEAGALELIVPRKVDWSPDHPRACANIKITVWVPQDSTLARLSVNAVHLGITLLDNLSLTILEGSKLTSTVGTITSSSTGAASRDDDHLTTTTPPQTAYLFNSRIIDVHTTAAPIKGIWPLYDYLGLQSTAGNIRVSVTPHPGLPDAAPKPAILYVKSLSGDVEVREPIRSTDSLPPRDYRVDVHTTSGDITAAVAFGSAAGFKSTSGNVKLEVLPVLEVGSEAGDDREVSLSTGSTSGDTEVAVLEPLWVGADGGVFVDDEGRALRVLTSTHGSTSGNVKARYPGSWEGDISLASLSGRLSVGGKGVKLIKAGGEWPGVNKSLVARKGEKGEGGKIVVKTTSGDVDVLVGEK